ncbi:hypothetical protein M3223_08875 [Paenibacillus pasadenensis]|uniref:hypothetical protein n=1 Tax=Paenibacillus pasadenensis TaxID=217090 RepID=UPI00203F8EE1|nr:hypothetical protein [Paenibacillus pasadenensis]MCM3747467.1 hypothetical protein [Paenibacillus pasadenensis]
MPSQTPNLNLYKKNPQTDGQDTFNIETMLNDNWDKLDTAVSEKVDKASGKGLSTNDYTAADKTKLDGATNAATASRIVQRDTNGRAKVTAPSAADDIARKDTVDDAVQPLVADLTDAAPAALSLLPGLQTVEAKQDTPLRVKGIKGRTLLNMLGRAGRGDSLSGWPGSNGVTSLAAGTSPTGGSSIKLKVNTGFGNATLMRSPALTTSLGKNYVMVASVKNLSTTKIDAYFGGKSISVTSTNWTTVVIAAQKTSESQQNLNPSIWCWGADKEALFANIAVYEINADEYEAVLAMTQAQAAALYPYVDDIKNVNGAYVRQAGINLIPAISTWVKSSLTPTVNLSAPYELSFILPSAGQYVGTTVKVIPGQTYTISCSNITAGARLRVGINDGSVLSSGTYIADLGALTTNTFTVPTGVSELALAFMNGPSYSGTYPVTFTLKEPQLELGSIASPFSPQSEQYIYYPDSQLAASLDGTVYDELYTDNTGQARATRRFKSLDLTGDLAWRFLGGAAIYKTAILSIPNPLKDTGYAVKFDGKILKRVSQGGTLTNAADEHVVSDETDPANKSIVAITILNTDSGWGDSYTPTVDDVKAYFNGWKMKTAGQAASSGMYNGTGTKAWVEQYKVITTPSFTGEQQDINVALNNNAHTSSSNAGVTKSYRLQYQLATPTDEPVRSEGAIMLAEGANTLEVGYGAVVRELVTNMYYDSNWAIINYNNTGTNQYSKLAYRTKAILSVFRNRKEDRVFSAYTDLAYGNQRAVAVRNDYDPSAVYEVTYLALDTYLIGIPPTQISTEYATNQRSVSDELAKTATQLAGRMTVLENGTAQAKLLQWITPTLLNGWAPYESTELYAPAYKLVGNTVQIKGVVKGGNNYSAIFYLPPKYRPKTAYHGVTMGQINNVIVPSYLSINDTGTVFISSNAAGSTASNYNYINAIVPLD